MFTPLDNLLLFEGGPTTGDVTELNGWESLFLCNIGGGAALVCNGLYGILGFLLLGVFISIDGIDPYLNDGVATGFAWIGLGGGAIKSLGKS